MRISPILIYTVRGESMQPIFVAGNKVYANKLAYVFKKPKVNDVVIIKHPQKDIRAIKRISSASGDEYFLEGDNSNKSTDSRHFGPVKRSDIIGKVISNTISSQYGKQN